MKRIGSYEAKTKLPALLELVLRGESFTITRRGAPIAVLRPFEETEKESTLEAIENIRNLSQKLSLGKISLKKLIEDGRS